MPPSSSVAAVADAVLGAASWLDVAKSVWRDAHRRAVDPDDVPTRSWAMTHIANTYPHAPSKRDLRAFQAWLLTPEFTPPPSRGGSLTAQ